MSEASLSEELASVRAAGRAAASSLYRAEAQRDELKLAAEQFGGDAVDARAQLAKAVKALSAARGQLDANATYIMRSTRNAENDALYSRAVTVWANEAHAALTGLGTVTSEESS